MAACEDDDATCHELVAQLRNVGGETFLAAADAYDRLKGGRVYWVDDLPKKRGYNGLYDRKTNNVWLNASMEEGDRLMLAVHEAAHMPTWLNLGNEYGADGAAVFQQFLNIEEKAFKELGPLNWLAPYYHDRLNRYGRKVDFSRPLPPIR